jgi:excisionase family DNA binding protein
MDHYLTTGQVAEQLKTSTQTVRNYCESGVIKATRSAGGHYRIEPDELARLKNLESLPPVARATLSGNSTRPAAKRNPNELLSAPSLDAIDAAELAYRSERDLATDTNQLARLRVRREAAELTDWFADRTQARRDKEIEEERRQAEAYEQQVRRRQAQAAAEERRQFEKKWLSHALGRKPWDAWNLDEYEAVVQPEVTAMLAELQTDEDPCTVERLVDAAVARALKPWRREQQRHKAVERALDSLPWSMRSKWKDRARIIAFKALTDAAEDATEEGFEAIAKEALKPLVQKFEHDERVDSATRFLILRDATSDEDEEARQIAREALLALPVDASRQQFERTKEAALEPLRTRIAERVQKQRDEAERQALLACIESWMPTNLPAAGKATALAEANKAVAALSAGTSDAEREEAAREAIDRQAAKERLIDAGVQEVPRHAQRLLRDYRYSANETAHGIEERVRSQVEKVLRKRLRGTETSREVIDMVRDAMEDAEGCN